MSKYKSFVALGALFFVGAALACGSSSSGSGSGDEPGPDGGDTDAGSSDGGNTESGSPPCVTASSGSGTISGSVGGVTLNVAGAVTSVPLGNFGFTSVFLMSYAPACPASGLEQGDSTFLALEYAGGLNTSPPNGAVSFAQGTGNSASFVTGACDGGTTTKQNSGTVTFTCVDGSGAVGSYDLIFDAEDGGNNEVTGTFTAPLCNGHLLECQ